MPARVYTTSIMGGTDDELQDLLDKLMPVLERAIQGDFSGRIELKPGDRFNEIYVGVQTLLEIIQEQTAALHEANVSISPELVKPKNTKESM